MSEGGVPNSVRRPFVVGPELDHDGARARRAHPGEVDRGHVVSRAVAAYRLPAQPPHIVRHRLDERDGPGGIKHGMTEGNEGVGTAREDPFCSLPAIRALGAARHLSPPDDDPFPHKAAVVVLGVAVEVLS